ncbi:PHA/PHB synthase family protein [Massilia sp. S19_KUP03_FR1]|uniref:PHA/PHB synthase family protein n=1 Tax=Massilia sp. S19_KUP03_FR1 TaxID=3025503 RepID=UPI002FCDD385
MDTYTAIVPTAEPDSAACAAAPGRGLDQALHAQIAWWTQGLSPASLAAAASDWLVHLAGSPAKQVELVMKAQRKMLRLAAFAAGTTAPAQPCIEPLPQDRRFAAPEWQRWPFNVIYQSFLLEQQWWYNATTGVPGVTRHHEQLWTFAMRQLLDMVAPSNFLATNPVVLAETARSHGANLLAGGRNLVQDAMPAARAPQQFVPGRDVAVTPGKVIYRNRLIELIAYQPSTATVCAEPVLMVPPWIMKYYILDLSPANSLVRYLVDQGHTVYMISWKNPDAADRELGMDDYLKLGVLAAIDQVGARHPRQGIAALGYCLGGTLLAIAAAALARTGDTRLASLTLLAAQVDFTEPGELGLFIDESQLNFLDNVMARKGYLDGKQMEGAFALLNSKDMVWSRMVQNYLLGKGQRATSDLAAWNADATRMPYRQQSEYLRSLYLNNDLAQGRYLVDGRPVALSDLDLPLFVLGTQRDTVAPWTSVFKAHLLTDAALTFCLTSGGHNAGVVNPPQGDGKQHYQLATREPDGRYLDPEAWRAAAPVCVGSWWPAWEHWLRSQSRGQLAALPVSPVGPNGLLDDAPGRYVLAP